MNATKSASPASLWNTEIRRQVEHSIAVKQALLADAHLLEQVENLSAACLAALRAGSKIIFAGNGGSFADSQHLSAEFTCRFMFDRKPLAWQWTRRFYQLIQTRRQQKSQLAEGM